MCKVFKEIKETNSTLSKKFTKWNIIVKSRTPVMFGTSHAHTPKRIKRKPISHDKTKNNKGRKEVLKAGREKWKNAS